MSRRELFNVFKRIPSLVIGMIHVRALPGTARHSLSMKKIKDIALSEVDIYAECGIDGIIIENMHDLPYICGENIGPEIVASMASVTTTIKTKFPEIPTGIQILKAGNIQSMAVAHSTGCDFIRAECFAFSHISDAGWVNASAGELLRYRKQIGAEDILIFTDIKKKHSSHSITSDLSVVESGQGAEFFLSDGLVVTGTKTGSAANQNEIKDLQSAVDIPVLVGSGVTTENVHQFVNADALIVGSHFKASGLWSNEMEHSKVKNFMEKVKELRT
ncbi:uncharacterized protein F13E9.13, mitochondrial-like [Styela clava]